MISILTEECAGMSEFCKIPCRCVACGRVTLQPVTSEEDVGRNEKQWFCGCSPQAEPKIEE